jgi:hydroxypyruvate reductase
MGAAEQLRDDALRIWLAGVAAVHPARLVPEYVRTQGDTLWVGDEGIPLRDVGRIVVVGGGKASGAMAAALEAALPAEVSVDGWVNAPADAIPSTARIDVHAARRPGANEPTEAAAAGVREMLHRVGQLGPRDLCFCLLSGGGSALMPAPIDGVSLEDKLALTRELSARGANIRELNIVRRELSVFKGGGLARACRAGRLLALILSDVPGDDLATIASGPTVIPPSTPGEAIVVLESFGLDDNAAGRRAIERLQKRRGEPPAPHPTCRVTNLVIGNLAAAVDAAGVEAERLGYSHAMVAAAEPEGAAEDVGRRLAGLAAQMRHEGPDCLISGGEPTVCLAPIAERGLGGRNQQLCLAAFAEMPHWRGAALVSGGTDGEDGPTDAAGAWVDEQVAEAALQQGLDARAYLARNDAYHFFAATGGLLKTGATHTNVGDLRVVTVSR